MEVIAPPPDPVRHFASWVAASCPPGSAVLDVGGGCNASGRFPGVRRRAAFLVAVDPSPLVRRHSDADELHQLALEDFAPAHGDQFDVAFAVFVLEHVADPVAFTDAAARVLKPGGVFLALTLNRWHYFGSATWMVSRLGLDEWLLRRLRDPRLVEEYHFRTEYRLNTVRCISRHLERAGFADIEFRMWDLPSAYEPYLPGRAARLAPAWSRVAYRLRRPALMGHLAVRARLGG